jgi:hypothetical protein
MTGFALASLRESLDSQTSSAQVVVVASHVPLAGSHIFALAPSTEATLVVEQV